MPGSDPWEAIGCFGAPAEHGAVPVQQGLISGLLTADAPGAIPECLWVMTGHGPFFGRGLFYLGGRVSPTGKWLAEGAAQNEAHKKPKGLSLETNGRSDVRSTHPPPASEQCRKGNGFSEDASESEDQPVPKRSPS